MDKRKEANLRVKAHITEALFSLMREKSFSDISVTEIIKKAKVARASYYRNFSSKEEVLTQLIDGVLEDFKRISGFDHSNYRSFRIVRISFLYFLEYGNYILDMYYSGFTAKLLEQLNQFHEINAGIMPLHSIEKYSLYMYIGALFNTGIMWLQSGARESADDIAKAFCRYFGIPADTEEFDSPVLQKIFVLPGGHNGK